MYTSNPTFVMQYVKTRLGHTNHTNPKLCVSVTAIVVHLRHNHCTKKKANQHNFKDF